MYQSKFENVGLLSLATSGRSFKLVIGPEVYYVSVSGSLAVKDGHKKNVQIVRRLGEMRNLSCDKRESQF